MTGYNKVFLDTTPLIYFLDSDINFGEKTKLILEEVISEGKEIFTSAITCMEYMVYPYRTGNQDKIDAFFEFTGDCGIPIKAVDVEIARVAAAIRADIKILKLWILYNWLLLCKADAICSSRMTISYVNSSNCVA